MTFTQTELDYLAGQPLGRLATAKPDGTLQVSPVGFTYNATLKTIDVHGYNMARSKKYRNVADNGRVAFVVDDLASTNPWRPRCVEIRGRGEVAVDAKGTPIIRIHPQRVIGFGIDQVDTPAHSLQINARDIR
jgi:pyridoxamine 5'-phosphate oxidase family protein